MEYEKEEPMGMGNSKADDAIKMTESRSATSLSATNEHQKH
jgi:hypothetical protein